MERWFFPIRRVAQRDDNGCAVACLAMVAGLSYERARCEAFPRRHVFRDDESLMADGERIHRALERVGFTARRADDFREHRAPAILTFQWDPGRKGSYAHCIVWDPFRKRMLDPAQRHLDPPTVDHYLDLWHRSNMTALVVNGRRR